MVVHAANIIFRNLLKYRCGRPDRMTLRTPIESLAYAKIRKRPITVRYNLLLDMFYGCLGERLRPASLVRYTFPPGTSADEFLDMRPARHDRLLNIFQIRINRFTYKLMAMR